MHVDALHHTTPQLRLGLRSTVTPHHIPKTGEVAQEPQSDLGQVPLLAGQPSANLVCAHGDALHRPTRLKDFAHNVSTQHSI